MLERKEKVTPNGEITLDLDSGIFYVYDETYSDIVYATRSKGLAYLVFEDYCTRLNEGIVR